MAGCGLGFVTTPFSGDVKHGVVCSPDNTTLHGARLLYVSFCNVVVNFRRTHRFVCTAIVCLLIARHAQAQEVDYGALEQLFGAPVTTSATGSPQLASQAPADMQIITADDIRRSGATDIPGVLEFVAGIDVRRYTALDSEVSIGGFSQVTNPRLLVLINGRQVYLDSYGYTAWQTLPVQLADIRKIEVVQGPASALFGFNAASGVINIITYDPLTDRTDTMSAGIGTDGTYTGSLVSTLQETGKAGITVSLGGLKTNEYSTASQPAFNAPYDAKPFEDNFDIDARAKPTARTEVTLEITHSDAAGLNQSVVYVPTKFAFRFNTVKLGLSADTAWGLMSVQAYTNKDQTSLSIPVYNIMDDKTINEVSVVQANDLIKLAADHTIRVGLEYRSNREWGQSFNGSSDYQDYAASAMWKWQITPQLALTNAGRIDRLVVHRGDPLTTGDPYSQADYAKAQFTAPSFNSGLVYQPTDNDTFRLLVGRGVQAPSQIEFGFDSQQTVETSFGPITTVAVGNPYLKASTTTNYEFDYDRALRAVDSTLSTAFYYSQVRDMLSFGPNLPAVFNYPYLQYTAANIGNGESFGAKIVLNGSNAAGWRWNLGYTLTVVRAHLTYSGPPATPYDFNNSTPASAIVFGLGYSWRNFEADLQGKWQSRFTDVILDYTPSGNTYQPVAISNFVTLNARIGYNVTPHLVLALAGQQLQGDQTLETAGLPVERRILLSATYGF